MRWWGAGGVRWRNTGDGNEWGNTREQGRANETEARQVHENTAGKRSKRYRKETQRTQIQWSRNDRTLTHADISVSHKEQQHLSIPVHSALFMALKELKNISKTLRYSSDPQTLADLLFQWWTNPLQVFSQPLSKTSMKDENTQNTRPVSTFLRHTHTNTPHLPKLSNQVVNPTVRLTGVHLFPNLCHAPSSSSHCCYGLRLPRLIWRPV